MRLNLKVPFAEKDQAKKLGARWDGSRKTWYIEDKRDLTAFARWSPMPHDDPLSKTRPRTHPAAARQRSSGILHVGSNYIEHPKVCDCPPWEVCDKCQAAALPSHV